MVGPDFELIPAGATQAVCIGVFDIGRQQDKFGIKHQGIISFELKKEMTKGDNAGKRFVYNMFLTASINEKSNITKIFESWFARKFTPEEQKNGYDFEQFVGKQAYITFIHKAKSDGSMTAVAGSIIALPEGLPDMIPQNQLNVTPEWIKNLQAKAIPEEDPVDQGDFSDETAGSDNTEDFYDNTGFNPTPVDPPKDIKF